MHANARPALNHSHSPSMLWTCFKCSPILDSALHQRDHAKFCVYGQHVVGDALGSLHVLQVQLTEEDAVPGPEPLLRQKPADASRQQLQQTVAHVLQVQLAEEHAIPGPESLLRQKPALASLQLVQRGAWYVLCLVGRYITMHVDAYTNGSTAWCAGNQS